MPPVRRRRRGASIGTRMSRRLAARRKTTRSRSTRRRGSRVVKAPRGKTYNSYPRAYTRYKKPFTPASGGPSRYFPGISYASAYRTPGTSYDPRRASLIDRQYFRGPTRQEEPPKAPSKAAAGDSWYDWAWDTLVWAANSTPGKIVGAGAVKLLKHTAGEVGDIASEMVSEAIADYMAPIKKDKKFHKKHGYQPGETDVPNNVFKKELSDAENAVRKEYYEQYLVNHLAKIRGQIKAGKDPVALAQEFKRAAIREGLQVTSMTHNPLGGRVEVHMRPGSGATDKARAFLDRHGRDIVLEVGPTTSEGHDAEDDIELLE